MERKTFQKQLILDVINNSYDHPTAEDIYAIIVEKYPNISKATVYRNLKLMAEKDLIKKIEIADSNIHYDKLDTHYHKKCIKCNKLIDLTIDYQKELDSLLNEEIIGHDIIFKYICEDCKSD